MKLTDLLMIADGAYSYNPAGQSIFAYRTQGRDAVVISTYERPVSPKVAAPVANLPLLPEYDEAGQPVEYSAADLQDIAAAVGFTEWRA